MLLMSDYRSALLAEISAPVTQGSSTPSYTSGILCLSFTFTYISQLTKNFSTMAKGNMFQGMARGKVGDVVFSRTNGEQISRVRNRHPNNPRTNKQMFQRAVMATVMQAYSAGKEIFDHAFQGKAVGAESQRVFLSKNAKLLRGQIASELAAGTTALNCNAAVVAPGAITPVPNEYMISEGTYPQTLFVQSDETNDYSLPAALTNETVAQYASRNGMVPGDIYTFVMFVISSYSPTFSVRDVALPVGNMLSPASQYPATFAFVRLQVKDLSAVSTPVASAKVSDLFEVTMTKNAVFNAADFVLSDPISVVDFTQTTIPGPSEEALASIGLIRSRLDQDLRSTSFMRVAANATNRESAGMYGITSPYALAAWKQGTENLGDSDLILEGGDE